VVACRFAALLGSGGGGGGGGVGIIRLRQPGGAPVLLPTAISPAPIVDE
jgi:hypothetical protein